jgi:hypothetical protein
MIDSTHTLSMFPRLDKSGTLHNSGLGYKQTHIEKGSSSMMKKNEAEQKSYAEVIRGPIKKE